MTTRLKKDRINKQQCLKELRKKFDLKDCLSNDSVEYNTEEFLFNFQMSRKSFRLLLKEPEDKKAFLDCKKRKQHPIAYQLLVFYVGLERKGHVAVLLL
jgi:hypothetical protein